MNPIKLSSIDPDDIEDWLFQVEHSFNIRFDQNELGAIRTFGDLCDHITGKLPLKHVAGCTTQQAFYKLRRAVGATIPVDHLTPGTLLVDVLPRRQRTSRVRAWEKELGYKLSLLRPPHFVTYGIAAFLLASLLGSFMYWQTGVPCLLLSIIGLNLASKLGNELTLVTVGELAIKMTQEHYRQSRRYPDTINRHELEALLTSWFSTTFDVPKMELTRDASFV